MNEDTEDQTPLLNAALRYAKRGWHVIPVGAGTDRKLPFIKNWTTEATTDEGRIRHWWLTYPDANVGIATGAKSGFWVVDVDLKNGVSGLDSLAARFGRRFDLDVKACLVGKTASGGFHLLFQWDPALPVRNGQAVLPGVDIRGEGGQIVVAPSYRVIGGERCVYRWNDESLPISSITEWARELATDVQASVARPLDVTAVMTGLSEGTRDSELWRYACHLAARGVPLALALGFMSTAAARCVPPFDPGIAAEKVLRAYREKAAPTVLNEAIKTLGNEIQLRKETNHE